MFYVVMQTKQQTWRDVSRRQKLISLLLIFEEDFEADEQTSLMEIDKDEDDFILNFLPVLLNEAIARKDKTQLRVDNFFDRYLAYHA